LWDNAELAFSEVLVASIALRTRIGLSLTAVGVTWLLSGVAFSIYYRDTRALYVFWIWSVPFFAVGWVIVGIPMIALSYQRPLTPGSSLILGITGALAGGMIMLAPGALARWISPQTHFVPFAWTELTGWPAFGAASGAAGPLFDSWLLSKFVSTDKMNAQSPDRVPANLPDM
jgi:hypothetical protein